MGNAIRNYLIDTGSEVILVDTGLPAEHDVVAFEDLPADWKCPRCKQGKEKFNRA